MANRRRVNLTGRPTPREPKAKPSNAAVIFFCSIMVLVILASLAFGLLLDMPTKASKVQSKIAQDSLAPTYTYDGEIIRWYVLTDPDTGIQYLVNDRGGCTTRLDAYGNVMKTTVYD